MTREELLSVVVNDSADAICKKLDAYAVLVLALVEGEDGELSIPTGLVGSDDAARYIGERMHGIGEMMVKASDSPPQEGEMYTDVKYIAKTPPLGRG